VFNKALAEDGVQVTTWLVTAEDAIDDKWNGQSVSRRRFQSMQRHVYAIKIWRSMRRRSKMAIGKKFNFIASWLIFEQPNSVDVAFVVPELA
jgi:hypothetical protein